MRFIDGHGDSRGSKQGIDDKVDSNHFISVSSKPGEVLIMEKTEGGLKMRGDFGALARDKMAADSKMELNACDACSPGNSNSIAVATSLALPGVTVIASPGTVINNIDRPNDDPKKFEGEYKKLRAGRIIGQ